MPKPREGDGAAAPMFYIYGKHSTQARFRPMDLSKGERVVNLIFASCLTEEEKVRFFAVCAKENPDWTFKARPIPSCSGPDDSHVSRPAAPSSVADDQMPVPMPSPMKGATP